MKANSKISVILIWKKIPEKSSMLCSLNYALIKIKQHRKSWSRKFLTATGIVFALNGTAYLDLVLAWNCRYRFTSQTFSSALKFSRAPRTTCLDKLKTTQNGHISSTDGSPNRTGCSSAVLKKGTLLIHSMLGHLLCSATAFPIGLLQA